MRILIAEDEYYARKALKQKLAGLLPQDEIVECENGLVALEGMEEEACDILFLDIRMPEMNGLDVAAQVSRLYPESYMIILTGYGDFEYARSAIRHGVRDYLLKPVSPGDLESAVNRAVSGIQDMRRKREERLEKDRKKRLLSGILTEGKGKLPPEDMPEGRVMCFLVRPVPGQLPALPEDVCVLEAGRNLAVLLPIEDTGDKAETRADNLVQTLLKVRGDTRISCSAVLSWDHLHEAYVQAQFALLMRLLDQRKLYRYEEIQALPYRSLLSQSEEERFAGMLKDNGKAAMDTVEGVIRSCRRETVSPYALQDAVMRLCARINHCMLTACSARAQEEVLNLDLDLEDMESLADVQERLEDAVRLAIALQKRPPGSSDEAVQFLKSYVAEHYDQNISFHELAENQLYMNVSYISRVFRQKEGISFRDYLTRYRLEKARTMLDDFPSQSIISIGSNCGYSDASQFIALFRRAYGVTPSQYRREKEKQS